VNKKVREMSVGYDEPFVMSMFRDHGFEELAVRYAGWCGRAPLWEHHSGLGDQDVVLATKG
jgi:hypothetical protein